MNGFYCLHHTTILYQAHSFKLQKDSISLLKMLPLFCIYEIKDLILHTMHMRLRQYCIS